MIHIYKGHVSTITLSTIAIIGNIAMLSYNSKLNSPHKSRKRGKQNIKLKIFAKNDNRNNCKNQIYNPPKEGVILYQRKHSNSSRNEIDGSHSEEIGNNKIDNNKYLESNEQTILSQREFLNSFEQPQRESLNSSRNEINDNPYEETNSIEIYDNPYKNTILSQIGSLNSFVQSQRESLNSSRNEIDGSHSEKMNSIEIYDDEQKEQIVRHKRENIILEIFKIEENIENMKLDIKLIYIKEKLKLMKKRINCNILNENELDYFQECVEDDKKNILEKFYQPSIKLYINEIHNLICFLNVMEKQSIKNIIHYLLVYLNQYQDEFMEEKLYIVLGYTDYNCSNEKDLSYEEKKIIFSTFNDMLNHLINEIIPIKNGVSKSKNNILAILVTNYPEDRIINWYVGQIKDHINYIDNVKSTKELIEYSEIKEILISIRSIFNDILKYIKNDFTFYKYLFVNSFKNNRIQQVKNNLEKYIQIIKKDENIMGEIKISDYTYISSMLNIDENTIEQIDFLNYDYLLEILNEMEDIELKKMEEFMKNIKDVIKIFNTDLNLQDYENKFNEVLNKNDFFIINDDIIRFPFIDINKIEPNESFIENFCEIFYGEINEAICRINNNKDKLLEFFQSSFLNIEDFIVNPENSIVDFEDSPENLIIDFRIDTEEFKQSLNEIAPIENEENFDVILEIDTIIEEVRNIINNYNKKLIKKGLIKDTYPIEFGERIKNIQPNEFHEIIEPNEFHEIIEPNKPHEIIDLEEFSEIIERVQSDEFLKIIETIHSNNFSEIIKTIQNFEETVDQGYDFIEHFNQNNNFIEYFDYLSNSIYEYISYIIKFFTNIEYFSEYSNSLMKYSDYFTKHIQNICYKFLEIFTPIFETILNGTILNETILNRKYEITKDEFVKKYINKLYLKLKENSGKDFTEYVLEEKSINRIYNLFYDINDLSNYLYNIFYNHEYYQIIEFLNEDIKDIKKIFTNPDDYDNELYIDFIKDCFEKYLRKYGSKYELKTIYQKIKLSNNIIFSNSIILDQIFEDQTSEENNKQIINEHNIDEKITQLENLDKEEESFQQIEELNEDQKIEVKKLYQKIESLCQQIIKYIGKKYIELKREKNILLFENMIKYGYKTIEEYAEYDTELNKKIEEIKKLNAKEERYEIIELNRNKRLEIYEKKCKDKYEDEEIFNFFKEIKLEFVSIRYSIMIDRYKLTLPKDDDLKEQIEEFQKCQNNVINDMINFECGIYNSGNELNLNDFLSYHNKILDLGKNGLIKNINISEITLNLNRCFKLTSDKIDKIKELDNIIISIYQKIEENIKNNNQKGREYKKIDLNKTI